MIKTMRAECGRVKINEKEVYRYLGYKTSDVKESTVRELVKKCIEDVEKNMVCKACYEVFRIETNSDGDLELTFMSTGSKDLARNLCGCGEIILFAATIGIEIDRIIGKSSKISASSAVVYQAVGAAAIEEWCDVLCEQLRKEYEMHGKFLKPRFSPGYGDFPLEAQKDIFRVLDCSKKAGISLTENYMMLPSKSVSAIIGISDEREAYSGNKCGLCKNTDCNFRKENI